MSLRIVSSAPMVGRESASGGDPADDWATRLAKLMPAEALGLYGAASAMVPTPTSDFPEHARLLALSVVAVVCAIFCVAIRWRATSSHGRPQGVAIVIALVSFAVWLIALGAPASPVQLPAGYTFAGPLAALLWATLVSYFYRGDGSPP